MRGGKPGKHIAHLIRMRDTKQRRLETYTGTHEQTSWLRRDIAALEYAIDVCSQALTEARLQRERVVPK